jgi:hypothetical protein
MSVIELVKLRELSPGREPIDCAVAATKFPKLPGTGATMWRGAEPRFPPFLFFFAPPLIWPVRIGVFGCDSYAYPLIAAYILPACRPHSDDAGFCPSLRLCKSPLGAPGGCRD